MLKTMLDILQTLSLSLSAVSFFYNDAMMLLGIQDACFLFFFFFYFYRTERFALFCRYMAFHCPCKLSDSQKIKFCSKGSSINQFGIV